jgi:tRNA(fMet)-specific endonuclease VapC
VSYLVDADWLIDAAMGRPRAQHLLERLSDDGLAVSIIAVAEIYEGAFGTPDPQATLDGLRAFLGDFAILPVTDPIVEQFARLRAAGRVNVFPTWFC